MSTVWLGELKVIVLESLRLSDVGELALIVETLLNWLLLY